MTTLTEHSARFIINDILQIGIFPPWGFHLYTERWQEDFCYDTATTQFLQRHLTWGSSERNKYMLTLYEFVNKLNLESTWS